MGRVLGLGALRLPVVRLALWLQQSSFDQPGEVSAGRARRFSRGLRDAVRGYISAACCFLQDDGIDIVERLRSRLSGITCVTA